MAEAIAALERGGATIVDPADIPSILARDPRQNFALRPICSGAGDRRGDDEHCSIVLKYGMKRDFSRWLGSLGETAPVRTLTELRDWNLLHRAAIKYGQAALDISDEIDLERDRPRYEADRATDLRLAGAQGIDQAMRSAGVDALLFPGARGAAIAARPGYPTVIVPFGMVPNAPPSPFPADFGARPSPFGVSFTGGACSEPKLLEIAYAFEQATRRRIPPPVVP